MVQFKKRLPKHATSIFPKHKGPLKTFEAITESDRDVEKC